jgi:Ras-related protein Rab-8A
MNYIIKVALVGDYGVGKSCIVSRFVKDYFSDNEMSTLGVDFDCKIIDFKDNKYKIQIWDTAGQEKFQSIVKSYIRDLNVCVLVFDVTQDKTFLNLKKWLNEVRYITDDENLLIYVVGNKSDLRGREVPKIEVEEFCQEEKIEYIECSAKNNKNINELFINIVEIIDLKVVQNNIKLKRYGSFEESRVTDYYDDKPPNKCCIIS